MKPNDRTGLVENKIEHLIFCEGFSQEQDREEYSQCIRGE